MSARSDALIIGGEPRVDLLPGEVRKDRKARVIRRRFGLACLGVLAIVVVGVGAATTTAREAQTQLQEEQARTTDLLAEQSRYSEVRTVQKQVELAKAAQQVGVSTEIDWKKYLKSVQSTLPDSVTINTVNVDSASPLAIYTQSSAPLQGARVATVSFMAKSAVLPDVPTWLDALATLPGFADALPGSVNLDATTGMYTVNITMHVNDAAFAQRFVTEGK